MSKSDLKPKLLLTPELKKKVDDKIRECYDIAEKKWDRKFELPEVRYNIKSHIGGMAYHTKNLLRLNLILLVENEDHYIKHVIPHEVAHLINYQVHEVPEGRKRLQSHGKEWKAVMDVMGVPADVCHTYDCSSIEKTGRSPVRRSLSTRIHSQLELVLKIAEKDPELYDKIARHVERAMEVNY